MSIFDRLNPDNFVVVEVQPDLCRFCNKDMNKVGYVLYCECVYDDSLEDCEACRSSMLCVECDDRFKGLELSLSIFYC